VRFQRNTWGTLGIFHREINNNSSASMLAIGLEDGADFVTIGEDGTNTGPGELPTHLRVHGTLIARNAVVTESPTFTNKSRVARPLRMIAGTVDTSGAIKQGTGFTVQRLNAGNAAPGQTFKVNFDDEFDGAPSFVVTVVGESNFYPTDNAVVIDRQPGYCQVKTGNLDSTTTGSYRSFSFVAVGNVKEA
jgi:hypothetical protein